MTADPLDAESLGADAIPDVPAAVLGWRQWRMEIVDGRPRLRSPIRPAPWEPRIAMTATCPTGTHPAPADGCTCGLYAARTIGRAAHAADGPTATMVIGRVALWGEVVEGDHGWRATVGYPVVLLVDPTVEGELIDRLATDYGVEVRRRPVDLSFLRTIPTVEQVPHRVRDERRRARVVELLARHRTAAETTDRGTVDEFLDVTRALFDELRRASLLRIPREAARASAYLYLMVDLWVLLLILLNGPLTARWPPSVVGAVDLPVMAAVVWVLNRMVEGMVGIFQVLNIRFLPGPARVLRRTVVAPVLLASLLQAGLVGRLLDSGQLVEVLLPSLAVVPLGVAVLGLVGWRRCFPPAHVESSKKSVAGVQTSTGASGR